MEVWEIQREISEIKRSIDRLNTILDTSGKRIINWKIEQKKIFRLKHGEQKDQKYRQEHRGHIEHNKIVWLFIFSQQVWLKSQKERPWAETMSEEIIFQNE